MDFRTEQGGLGMGKRVAECGVLVALALIFSYVEVLIPIPFPVPGMKLGLANLIVVCGLYFMKWQDVLTVSVLRIVLSGFLFGNMMSILYSLAGGIASFLVMVLLKRGKGFSTAGVSALGGVGHNIGQLVAAMCFVKQLQVLVWLPALVVSGILTGALIGMIAQRLFPALAKIQK